LIVAVKPDSPASEAGLHEADMITHVGNREVQSASDAQKALSDAKSPVRLRIVRQGHGIFVVLSTSD
jgi:C-terminal processing protease CtpA/Prc